MTRRSAAITVATVVLMSACAGQGALEPVGAPTNNSGTAAPPTTAPTTTTTPPTTATLPLGSMQQPAPHRFFAIGGKCIKYCFYRGIFHPLLNGK